MKNPRFGSNREQSFIEFIGNLLNIRFGLEGKRLFIYKNETEFNLDGKIVNQTFTGEIDLSNDLTHYNNYSVITDVDVTLKSEKIIGGAAEIRFVGDGSHDPVFDAAFTKSSSSDDYDNTENVVNKVVFYYDGEDAFYSITVLA